MESRSRRSARFLLKHHREIRTKSCKASQTTALGWVVAVDKPCRVDSRQSLGFLDWRAAPHTTLGPRRVAIEANRWLENQFVSLQQNGVGQYLRASHNRRWRRGQAPLVRKSACHWRRPASRWRRAPAEWIVTRTATNTTDAVIAAMNSGVMLMGLTLAVFQCAQFYEKAPQRLCGKHNNH